MGRPTDSPRLQGCVWNQSGSEVRGLVLDNQFSLSDHGCVIFSRDPVLVPPGALAAPTSTDLPTGDPILAKLSSQFTQPSAISNRLAGTELQAAVSASLLNCATSLAQVAR